MAARMPAVRHTLWALLAIAILLFIPCRALLDTGGSGHTFQPNALHMAHPQRRLQHDTGVLPTTILSHAAQKLTEEEETRRRQDTVDWKDVSHMSTTATDHAQKAHMVLFIGILSRGRNQKQRDAIRATWGADHRIRRMMFFVALPLDILSLNALQHEAAHQGDLALEPHTHEAYWNVTNQTLDMYRAAIVDPSFTHFMKVDDDSYVRVSPLLNLLGQLPHRHMMVGNIGQYSKPPNRNTRDSWSVTREDWGRDSIPMWADGGSGYVLSMDLVREIAAGAAVQAGSLKYEDVTAGIWVEQAALLNDWVVMYAFHTGFNSSGCGQGDITSHRMIPERMLCIYEHLEKDCCENMNL